MLACVSQIVLFLELVSCISIPPQGNSLNLAPAPHHVALSKHRRQETLSRKSFNKRSNSTLIRPTGANLQYAVEVKFNGVPRYLLLDTGSSDTWMFGHDFQCLSNTSCNTGPRYTGEIDRIPGEAFNIVYGNNENITGQVGYADVSVAGLSVENQVVSVVTEGYWQGDGVLSGVLGVGSYGLTSAFEEANPNELRQYSPVFESMYNKTGQIDPVFSLALQRGDDAGYLAFGGLPPVDVEHDFASTKIVGVPFGKKREDRPFYAIENFGVELNGKTHNQSFQAVVDSGTYPNRFPAAVADKINAAFKPPAVYIEEYGAYAVPCNATAPDLGIAIGGKIFYMHPTDMFVPIGQDGICTTSIYRGFDLDPSLYPDGLYILGDVFLHNVVAVYDIGNEQIHFAPHNDY
ncbi:hypothetical protein PISL3812_04566 [Talaromyces islandicus]|uniref:Peptidase A1 domain-containing protein n=1 Tax=Talaromyces islandicus TaxID=28573 RepID=A0A0U1LVW3_TALIS|nr:hypothetical protein PISL3812_04566 [Talaromyces islandicus]